MFKLPLYSVYKFNGQINIYIKVVYCYLVTVSFSFLLHEVYINIIHLATYDILFVQ